MSTIISLLSILSSCFTAITLAQRSQGLNNQLQAGQDYIDIPVRAGYRIVGDDNEGYLEDGIIVKTKGTGYIDPRYRKKYFTTTITDDDGVDVDENNRRFDVSSLYRSPMQESMPTIRKRRFDQYFNTKKIESSASSSYSPRYYTSFPKKYLKSEIIYGRRATDW